jgi:hypothetical protein
VALVVGVHGIGQQGSNPDRQFRLWSDSMLLGMTAGGCPAKVVPVLAVPFYGGIFRRGSSFLGENDSEPLGDAEEWFLVNALCELTTELSNKERDEFQLAPQFLGPPAVIPPALIRGLATVDHRWGRGMGWLLVRVLRQVHAYLYREDTASEIRRIVQAEIGADTRVLIGHSLGSVVAYDLLRRDLVPQVEALVTLGSPLAWATVQRALSAASASLGCGAVSWSNVFDPWDVVTAGRGLGPGATNLPVDNGRSDPHALRQYLAQKKTGRVILAETLSAGPVL